MRCASIYGFAAHRRAIGSRGDRLQFFSMVLVKIQRHQTAGNGPGADHRLSQGEKEKRSLVLPLGVGDQTIPI